MVANVRLFHDISEEEIDKHERSMLNFAVTPVLKAREKLCQLSKHELTGAIH